MSRSSSSSSEKKRSQSSPVKGKKVSRETRHRQFLADQREVLYRLHEEATCVTQAPADAFQHRLLLNNLDTDLLEQDLHSALMFDHSLHRELGCLMDALVHRYTDESVHDRVRTTITRPVPIGEDKNNVFTSGFRGNAALFVIKTDTLSHLECLYEYVVGKILINPLRALIPNFMYTYGYHECSNYAVEWGKTLRWCNTDEADMGYLYLEKINGIRMDDFLLEHKEDSPEFVEVMLQLINALYVADKHCSFRHNDLKPANIIIRELGEPINIPFTVLGRSQYVRSRWIPQILDFGISTSVYDGKELVSPLYSNANGDRGKDFPYDLDYLLRTSSGWFRDEEESHLRELFYDRLFEDGKKKSNRTFAHIAKVFITIFGDDALHDEADEALTLPFTVIDNTHRFYQRYFLTRPYHLSEYYDLINLINKYNLRETPALPTSTNIVQVARAISDEVLTLLNSRPEGDFLYLKRGKLHVSLDDLLVIINTVADYAYVLLSFERMVLPLARKHKLISIDDDKYVREVIATVSHLYRGLLEEAHELYPATERAFFREGYDYYMYESMMRDLALKLAYLPRLENM